MGVQPLCHQGRAHRSALRRLHRGVLLDPRAPVAPGLIRHFRRPSKTTTEPHAMAPTGRRIRKRKLKAEINVVPYIDVMLVLLIIFMVTAPLMNLGVEVELPRADAKSITSGDQEPVVVSVDAAGNYFLTLQGAPLEAL